MKKHLLISLVSILAALCLVPVAFASQSLGGIANNATLVTGELSRFIIAGCFMVGFGFGVSAIVKYKTYRDNPRQITLSVPITLFFAALAFVFLGFILTATGKTIFGGSAQTGSTQGVSTFN